MVTVDQLPDDVMIRIKEVADKSAYIQYVSSTNRVLYPSYATYGEPNPWGYIEIEKYSWPNRIPVWEVLGVQAGQGYGPLLYDIAMEYATQNGIGLTSDRTSVSDDAVGVWDYYLENRVGVDVKAHQMDDKKNTLTPTPDDNNNQYISKKLAKVNWSDHSTSKRYTKAPTTLEALGNKVIYV